MIYSDFQTPFRLFCAAKYGSGCSSKVFLEFKEKSTPNPKLFHVNQDVDYFIPLYIPIPQSLPSSLSQPTPKGHFYLVLRAEFFASSLNNMKHENIWLFQLETRRIGRNNTIYMYTHTPVKWYILILGLFLFSFQRNITISEMHFRN